MTPLLFLPMPAPLERSAVDLQQVEDAAARGVEKALKSAEFPLISHEMGGEMGEKRKRARTVAAALEPRDYVAKYLDENSHVVQSVGVPDAPNALTYEDLARMISESFGVEVSTSTTWRVVKKWQRKHGK